MNEVSKNLMCISMRDGVEIWIEYEKVEPLLQMIETRKFIKVGDSYINVSDITGIYEASKVEEKTRRKNGEWKCKNGKWHEKFTKCGCPIRKGGKIFIHGLGWQDEPVLGEQNKP